GGCHDGETRVSGPFRADGRASVAHSARRFLASPDGVRVLIGALLPPPTVCLAPSSPTPATRSSAAVFFATVEQPWNSPADATTFVTFFDPCSGWTWFATEARVERDDAGAIEDVLYFGHVAGNFGEPGAPSLVGIPIERDLHFTPRPLSVCLKGASL